MTESGWIGIASILVTLALSGSGIVFGLIGWLLSRMIAANDREIKELRDSNVKLWARLTRYEVLMESHGWIPRRAKYPSPPPQNNIEENAG